MPDNELLILPVLKAVRGPHGGFVLTQKYMDGVAGYAKHWPGPVTSLVEVSHTPTTDMDHIEVIPEKAATGVELRPKSIEELTERIKNAALVSTFLSPFELPTAKLCKKLGVPIVFVSEYTLQTDIQIIHAHTTNPLLRFRRRHWARWAERKRRQALGIADGLQCSGTPTYQAYRELIDNTLLFFDNRVREDWFISADALARKAEDIGAGRPLRLVFGGRLIAMKGVMDLVPFAAALRQRNIPFTLDIYGDGPLKKDMAEQIRSHDLSDQVILRGAVDFGAVWVPDLQEKVDLFVCCHPQGDPSSTYPEVMACGVPIVGYDNEAFAGIAPLSQAGWTTPMHDVDALVSKVVQLHQERAPLVTAMQNARKFAAEHAFEATMQRRTRHLIDASRLPDHLKA